MVLNEKTVEWTKKDLSYLKKVQYVIDRQYVCVLLSNDLTKTLNVRIIFDKPKGLYLAFDILTEL